jgi:hypothetical protein
MPEDICSSLWGTAFLSRIGGRRSAQKPLSAHPVSPRAIKLGMDKALRIFHVHRAPEDLVYDDHQALRKGVAAE